jgi:hypothetical protein
MHLILLSRVRSSVSPARAATAVAAHSYVDFVQREPDGLIVGALPSVGFVFIEKYYGPDG